MILIVRKTNELYYINDILKPNIVCYFSNYDNGHTYGYASILLYPMISRISPVSYHGRKCTRRGRTSVTIATTSPIYCLGRYRARAVCRDPVTLGHGAATNYVTRSETRQRRNTGRRKSFLKR